MVFRPGLEWPTTSSKDVARKSSRQIRDDTSGDAAKSSAHAEDDASKLSEHVPTPPAAPICIIACSDASHGGEDEWLDDWEEREPFRSQGA